MTPRRLLLLVLSVGVVVTAWTAGAVNARSSYGNQTTGDEPHYLVTALSLGEDRSLDLRDELREGAYRPFHEQGLWEQGKPLSDGRVVAPHDPLLPVLLALPVTFGGWAAGKGMLAVTAGALAALLVWVAVRRFGVGAVPASVTVLAFSLSMPLTAYANQVYPELPAALAVAVAVALLTGRLRAWGVVGAAVAIIVLPWLSVKYAPVALAVGALLLVALWRDGRARDAWIVMGALAAAGAAYLVAHQLIYEGWTVYAAGEHFDAGGELSVMGYEPNYAGRAWRLVGLLVDRHFGLAAWAPVYLLAVPALVALARRRPQEWAVLVVPLVAGWLNATFVAQTMHGWWAPGRQVVVVLPLVVLAVAWWVGQRRALTWVVGGLGAVGAITWLWLVAEVLELERTLVVDFWETEALTYRAWSALLPDGGLFSTDRVGLLAWTAVLAVLGYAGWRSSVPASPSPAVRDRARAEAGSPPQLLVPN